MTLQFQWVIMMRQAQWRGRHHPLIAPGEQCPQNVAEVFAGLREVITFMTAACTPGAAFENPSVDQTAEPSRQPIPRRSRIPSDLTELVITEDHLTYHKH